MELEILLLHALRLGQGLHHWVAMLMVYLVQMDFSVKEVRNIGTRLLVRLGISVSRDRRQSVRLESTSLLLGRVIVFLLKKVSIEVVVILSQRRVLLEIIARKEQAHKYPVQMVFITKLREGIN